jgi:hypothetical protein
MITMKSSCDNENRRNREEKGGEEFGDASVEVDDDNSRNIRTILPHELERVQGMHEEMAKHHISTSKS